MITLNKNTKVIVLLIVSAILTSCETAPTIDKDTSKISGVLTSKTVAGCTKIKNPSSFSLFWGLDEGDILCLEDGLYTDGLIVPSGVYVKAIHRGKAVFKGGDMEWSSILAMNGENSTVDGLKIHHPDNSTSMACKISGRNNTMKNISCSHGGSYKHAIPLMISGSGHLIEDSWFYGEGRYVVQCYGGNNITIRRNIARWDSTQPHEAYEPNAAFSIYACSDMIIENNISFDYGVPKTAMKFGGDFYMPAHEDAGVTPNNNQFVGNFAINHAKNTRNRRAIRLDPDMPVTGTVIDNFIVSGSDAGFVFSSSSRNTEVKRCSLFNVDYIGAECSGPAIIPDIFPLANQKLIRLDMCAQNERQSDWCQSDLNLSEYILSFISTEKLE